jgi:hypothetical protein
MYRALARHEVQQRERQIKMQCVCKQFGQPDYSKCAGFRCSLCSATAVHSEELWEDPTSRSEQLTLRCFRHMMELVNNTPNATQ